MAYRQLTQEQRYYIEKNSQEKSVSEIAEKLGVHRSTVYREIKRNSCNGNYCYLEAQKRTTQRHRTKNKSTVWTEDTKAKVLELLEKDFSPEQISATLKKKFAISIHFKTIYRFIEKEKKKGNDLSQHLRILSKKQRRKNAKRGQGSLIPNRVCIDDRPDIINKKERIGDLEVDTIIGKGHKSALLTIVDRASKYLWIVKLKSGKNAAELAKACVSKLAFCSSRLHSMTFDNGLEFAEHEYIAEHLNIKTYFAHPYSPWERGLNENTNGLIRQYFPKGTDFNEVSDMEILNVQEKLNHRPRKILNFMTPHDTFFDENNWKSTE